MKFGFFPVLVLFVACAIQGAAGPRDAQWEKVEQARDAKLPKSAIAALEPIIAGALADKAYAEATKAIGQKIALEREIEGNKPEEQVTRIVAELEKAPPEMKPALETLLAHWYWHYFQNNRGRFLQRTQTAGAPGADFLTWDLPHILAEIDRHFTAALVDEKTLQSTPISAYDALLEKGTVPDAYRPTMYDFLAHEALAFYQAGEQAAHRAEDAFELDASSPIFADTADFARWKPESSDAASPVLKAIALYQKLLAFHRSDADPSAYYDVDLARLTYGHNVAVGEDKDERYNAALERFIKSTANHEISARALALLANQLNEAGDPARAHELANRGFKAFRKSTGGYECYNLIQQIEARSAQLNTEAVWNAPWPTLDITYRNVTQVYFRAVPADFGNYLNRQRWGGYGRTDRETVMTALQTKAAFEWDAKLPPTADFRERTESLPVPTALKPGFYLIVASHHPSFGETDNQLSAVPVWISNLALITQSGGSTGLNHGFVLQAGSGEPVAGATVQAWELNRNGTYVLKDTTTTDQDGRFPFSATNRQLILLASHAGQSVASNQPVWSNEGGEERPTSQVVFFTDRALYRPGQTISYKGIGFRTEPARADYQTLAGKRIQVTFLDANGKEIARAFHTTNDYGSFSGTFTAPRDRVLGNMSLRASGAAAGYASFRVEEYKRPKFQVEIAAPKDPPKLGAETKLTVKATAYTGAAIGGAKVKWRVTRGVQFPAWCWWWQPPPAKAVAHGTAVTTADGTVEIQFIAEPDRAVSEKTEPVFAYTLHADITDSTGETRSADHLIRIGYTALQASLAADEWQVPDHPVAFKLSTESLDGTPQSAEGVLTIHVLQQPAAVQRAALIERQFRYGWQFPRSTPEPKPDPTNPDSWALGDKVAEHSFKTDATGRMEIGVALPAGIYRASLETKDRFGRKVTARQTVQVLDPHATRYGIRVPHHLTAAQWSVEPGEKFTAAWGTGYERGRAFVALERSGKPLKSYWTAADRTQELIELSVAEEMRGGVTLRVTYVRENRAYLTERIIDVPWSNKQLEVKWESFRSKLLPGQKETWTAVVTGPDAKRSAAEMVAALYDASLDQFAPHEWLRRFEVFRREYQRVSSTFQNTSLGFNTLSNQWTVSSHSVDWRYRMFSEDLSGWSYFNDEEVIVLSPFAVSGGTDRGYRAKSTLAGSRLRTALRDEGSAVALAAAMPAPGSPPSAPAEDKTSEATDAPSSVDLNKVTARKNLNETAFFFPHLLAGDDGVVKMQFTMPEALTEWKFLGFAHDAKLRSGFLAAKVVTAKDLMVEPNPPRFVREGDVIEFTVKVTNQTDQLQTGKVRLTFADAATLQAVDVALGNTAGEQSFDVPAKESRSYSWRISVPDGMGFLTYKAVGATAQATDGEEGFLPVLSRRILVTESLPLPIRGQTTKEFEFTKLLQSAQSDSLRHQSLTVQMVSQPAWYAIMALPYLMEFPHECSEQLFNRLYANALARHIANADPKIRRVFDLWKNTAALDSPLEKNQDLKSVMIDETPWLRQAANESEARRNVGLLFDANRLDEESARILRQLRERQLDDGLWSWFPGGRPSEFISLYIVTGFGRLRHLGTDIDVTSAVKALGGLDAWMERRYREIQREKKPEEYVPGHLEAIYLYARSFFTQDRPIAVDHREAVDFFLAQSRKHWTRTDCRMCQAQLALALQRFGDKQTPLAIMKSLKERSVSSEELGMSWRDTEQGWWWYQAPIETQAMMIEAFDEVAQDARSVEDCKAWLLKQKQTQNWKTTKATADAVYGLLLRGTNLLASDALVEVALGGEAIKPEKVEAGTGFYEKKFVRDEIRPAQGRITVRKTDEGVSWGGVHWQYLEDMRKVTPHEGTPLTLTKTLFIKETAKQGPVLKPVTGPVAVGDELVVRLELRTDRDLEYVHLKDQRGSGTEPVNVLSQYKYQDGLGYYESTRDTASHFFIDYLRKGTYVFEYSTRVQLKGSYQTGIAEIQCMYAPEFNSHSESLGLKVH